MNGVGGQAIESADASNVPILGRAFLPNQSLLGPLRLVGLAPCHAPAPHKPNHTHHPIIKASSAEKQGPDAEKKEGKKNTHTHTLARSCEITKFQILKIGWGKLLLSFYLLFVIGGWDEKRNSTHRTEGENVSLHL